MRRSSERGQALVFAAASLVVLLLVTGLAIDMGYLRYQKRRMQTAADSAALAAASELNYGSTDYTNAAEAEAETNEPSLASTSAACTDPTYSNTVFTVNNPPQSGVDAGNTLAVEVILCENQPTFFSTIVGIKSAPVVARAVALLGSGPGCLYGLSGNSNAIEIGTNPILNVAAETILAGPGCTMMADGSVDLDTAPSHFIYSSSFGQTASPAPTGLNIKPPIVAGIIPAADPLAYLTPPGSPGTCTGSGPQVFTSGFVPSGPYPCGLEIEVPPSQVATLSGTYLVGGSGFTITDTGAGGGEVVGSGITIYTIGSNAAVNINYGASAWTDWGTTVQLAAPTSGAYAGVLFYQDPSDTQTGTITVAAFPSSPPPWGVTDNSYVWGALYFPKAQLNLDGIGEDEGGAPLDGCSPSPRFTSAVAYNLVLYGNLNFSSNDCSMNGSTWAPTIVSTSSLPPSPIKDAELVE